MRREGSAFQGLGTVFVKELSDNISSARMLVLELLVVLTALPRSMAQSTVSARPRPRIRSCSCGCSRWRAIPCRPSSPCSASWCR